MPKQEILYEPNQIYHIYNHANGFENLFEHKDHYIMFLNAYYEICKDVFTTYAFALMPNHFHLIVKVKDINAFGPSYYLNQATGFFNCDEDFEYEFSKRISQQFSNFLNSYVQKYNYRVNRKGSLFRQNSKRKLLDTANYLKTAIRYVHYNPVKDGFCQDLKDWQFSSYSHYLNGETKLIPVKEVLKIYGGQKKFLKDHDEKDIKKIKF